MVLCAVIFLGLLLVWHGAARVVLRACKDTWSYRADSEFSTWDFGFSHVIGFLGLILMVLVLSGVWAVAEAICQAIQAALKGGL